MVYVGYSFKNEHPNEALLRDAFSSYGTINNLYLKPAPGFNQGRSFAVVEMSSLVFHYWLVVSSSIPFVGFSSEQEEAKSIRRVFFLNDSEGEMRKQLSDKKVEINILPMVPANYRNLATIGEAMTMERSKQHDQNYSGNSGNRGMNQYGMGSRDGSGMRQTSKTNFIFCLKSRQNERKKQWRVQLKLKEEKMDIMGQVPKALELGPLL